VQGLKLPFVVTFASSYDDGYEPTQLEQGGAAAAQAAQAAKDNGDEKQTHAATNTHIKGWQSAKSEQEREREREGDREKEEDKAGRASCAALLRLALIFIPFS
jgi:hypothetical protein